MRARRPGRVGRLHPGLGTLFGLLACLAANAGRAQNSTIVFDGSMGTDGAVTPNGNTYTIDEADGRPVGRNLFHSFGRFDVAKGDVADFTSLSEFDNVIIRHTATDHPFRVDGTFRSSIADADVLVVSPFGVVTSEDALLDVPGSMYFSGASNVRFSDGESDFVLDATSATDEPLLTSLPPVAFGFDSHSGTVDIERTTGFTVDPGKTLSFTGTLIRGSQLTGGIGATSLGAAGNIVQLGAATAGELPLDLSGLDPGADDAPTMGNILLRANFKIDVSSAGTGVAAGRVVIRGGRFALVGSTLRSKNESSDDALGAIDVAASTDIQLLGGSEILSESTGGGGGSEIALLAPSITTGGASEVVSNATGSSIGGNVSLSGGSIEVTGQDSLIAVTSVSNAVSGNLSLAADHVSVTNDAQLLTNTTAASGLMGGSITLEGRQDARVSEGGQILGLSSGAARGGDIVVTNTSTLDVLAGGRIRTEAHDEGAGGTLRVSAGQVSVVKDVSDLRQTDISTSALASAGENATGGDLFVVADDVRLMGGGQIAVDTSGAARQGNLDVRVTDTVFATGRDESIIRRPSGLFSRANEEALPVDPDVRPILFIKTGDLELRDRAEISASTFGEAHGADIQILASNAVRIGRAGELAPLVSSSSLASGAAGSAGSIDVRADFVQLLAGGEIISDTVNRGDAGEIQISARVIDVAGRDPEGARSRISSESKSVALPDAGSAGNIVLDAEDRIRIANGGVVSVASAGTGGGGSIVVDAERSVTLLGGAEIRASADGVANAGTIRIRAGDSFESYASNVITRAAVLGGGQVRIEAGRLIQLVDSIIDARVQAGGGDGGDVFIDPEIVVLNNSDVIASAIDGFGGNITIIAPQLLKSQGSDLNATSVTNVPGEVVTTAPESELPSELASIERPFLDASDLMATPCDLRSERSGSFTVALATGLRSAPDRILDTSLLHPPGGDLHGACAPAETME